MNNGIDFQVLNPEQQPMIYSHSSPVVLSFALVNRTGNDIEFATGAKASQLEIFLPVCFTETEMAEMKITLPGWKFEFDNQLLVFRLICQEESPVKWENQGRFVFELENVVTGAQPQTDAVQVNFDRFPAEVPLQVMAPLSISVAPAPGNARLKEILQLAFDNQGTIFVSTATDPLKNTLSLNIRNTGLHSLFTGQGECSPRISVMFVYGNSTGCLAPDNQCDSGEWSGSAWNIKCDILCQEPKNLWVVENPSPFSPEQHPKWIFTPASGNRELIGTGENANISFRFSDVLSYTPIGYTQAVIQFSGFRKDDRTLYDDEVFVVGIIKNQAVIGRGALTFFSSGTSYAVDDTHTPVDIPLQMTLLRTAMAEIDFTVLGVGTDDLYIQPVPPIYTNGEVLSLNKTGIRVPRISSSLSLCFTLTAYTGKREILNRLQFMVNLRLNKFIDPRDGQMYNTMKAGKLVWMAENLRYRAPEGSNVIGEETMYGRVYTYSAARMGIPVGWRLPTLEEWEALIQEYPYEALIVGGESGFDAVFNGQITDYGQIIDQGISGYYWIDSSQGYYAYFSSRTKSMACIKGMPLGSYLSVRYVRDLK